MNFIDPSTGWFKISEVPYYDSKEVKIVNRNYINKTSAIISQLFNNTWLSCYPRPCRVGFDNVSESKKYFIPLFKYLDIKPVFTKVTTSKWTHITVP